MFQIGEIYKMKTYVHDFLDKVTVVDIYTENNTLVYVFVRPNGQVYHMTSWDLVAIDYYRIASLNDDDDSLNDGMTESMTDNEFDDDASLNGVFDPNEIFIDFDMDNYEPPQM